MAQASYTTDLVTLTQNETNAGIAEPTATGWTALSAITSAETDYYLQNAACTSATIKVGVGGLLHNNGAGFTIPTDGAVLCWAYFWAPGVLADEANGGARQMIGSALNAFYWVSHLGSDSWTYGGWYCMAMADPSATTVNTVGSPTATRQYTGWAYNAPSTVPGKGNPYGIDAIRYGRCTIQVTNGDATEYGRFDVIAAFNDKNTTAARTGFTLLDSGYHRLGLFQFQDGSYKWQGRLLLGTTTTAVDFRDSNRLIFVLNTKHVTANFNLIEVQNASSRVDWTGITIQSLGTKSRGRFLATANADINISGCTFNDMDTFVFQSNSAIDGTVFRRCNRVTQGGAPVDACQFRSSTDTVALVASSISGVTNCEFVSSGTGYAIEGFATAGDYSVATNTFSGYGATGTANAALRVTATTGTVNINAPGGTTYHSAGATVNIISGQRTLTLTGIVSGSDVVILTAGTSTELVNIDQNAGSTYAYSYTYSAGVYVDVCVYKQGYVPFTVRSYLLADGDGSLPINQVIDRNFVS